MRWAALLKGVNVGGNRKLPMAELKALVEGLGHTNVKTLLASGNVVFDCDEDGAALETRLEQALETLGLNTDVVVRNLADIERVIAADPFPDAAADHPSHYLVAFHRDPVPDGLIERVPELYTGPERLKAIGRELYLDYADNIGDSKLPQAMAKLKFPKLATTRNWNTVIKLRDLLA
ncbi:DUF1697 domain-containing protein [Sphingomonas sp. PB4P5]|uniref:DUF1697 domain-containing protein n=1 Tax=Parasphingomonas puruogangriensis TaxID=3096155 RepID=UPI002FCB461B